jgi:tetratricopeptide (TPR) repeat protein
MRLLVRWAVAAVGSTAAYLLAYWLGVRAGRLDAGTAETAGGLSAAFVLTVLSWWAPQPVAHSVAGDSMPEHRMMIGDVPGRPAGYRERKELIAALGGARGGHGKPILTSVTGMVGVGKTSLVAEYARARFERDRWRLVAWVNAGDEDGFLRQLARAAAALGLKTDEAEPSAAGRAVRHKFETDGERCLLVFNDAGDMDLLRPFIPVVGDAQVLITTNRQAAANLGNTVAVGVFALQEAVAFLSHRTERQDPVGASQVATELGCLPLALAQAVAVVIERDWSFETYLRHLRDEAAEDHLRHVEGDHYQRGTAAAILLSLDSVEDSSAGRACGRVMEMVSVLSPEGVPRALLHATSIIHDVDIDRALGRLTAASLLNFSVNKERVSAHLLVTRIVRDKLMSEGRFATFCVDVGDALIKRAASVRENWTQSAVRDLVDQIKALTDHMGSIPQGTDDKVTRCVLQLRLEQARFLDDLGGSPTRAIEAGIALVADAESFFGAEDRCTLTCRHNLAIAYQQAALRDKAVTLHKKNLDDRQRILGRRHTDTLTSQNNLATAYHDAGQYRRAIRLYEKNLRDRAAVLGLGHPDTCASRNNLAIAYQDAGLVEQAIPLHEANLELCQERPNHPQVPGIPLRSAASSDGEHTARMSYAIPLHESARADGQRIIRTGHPDFLGYQNNLATAYLEADRVREAVELLEITCEGKRQSLGHDHPSTLVSRSDLGAGYLKMGRAREATVLLNNALKDSNRILGSNNSVTRIILGNFAIAWAASPFWYRVLFHRNRPNACLSTLLRLCS